MTIHNFYCPCGFATSDTDEVREHMERGEPLHPDSCCNCGGQRCMDCVLRYQHGACSDDCPFCCSN